MSLVFLPSKFEAESMVLRQGHAPLECYLILAGRLRVVSNNTNKNKNSNSDILSEFEEGDLIGEICLLTNASQPTLVVCETNVKLLIVSKESRICSNVIWKCHEKFLEHFSIDEYQLNRRTLCSSSLSRFYKNLMDCRYYDHSKRHILQDSVKKASGKQ